MTKVIAWPPVGVTGAEWTEHAPVNVSRSLITGRRYVSAHARKRRLATLNVSSLSADRAGAGYMEILKRLLAGGENLVRLTSYDVNRSRLRLDLQSRDVTWDAPPGNVDWATSGGVPERWFSGIILTGVAGATHGSGLWHGLTVSGLPPNQIPARPGEFLTFITDDGEVTTQIVGAGRANGAGTAVVRVMDKLTGTGRVNIGTSDTAVFEAVNLPRAVRPVRGDWNYDWSFREVFADETPGGYVEVNPWI